MPAIRMTQRILVDQALTNLRGQTLDYFRLQQQLSTGLRVNAPSDDPIAARRAVSGRNAIARNEQFIDNIVNVRPYVTETDTAIQSMLQFIGRAHELTLQGASGTLNPDERALIAEEVNELLEGVFSTGNHITNGRHIFAGTRTDAPAFTATRNAAGEIDSVTYAGNDAVIRTPISESQSIVSNETGADVFQANQDVFELLRNIRDDLRGNDTDALRNLRIDELETARDQMLQSLSRIGATENRFNRVEEEYADFNIVLEQTISDSIDADFSEVLIELNARNNSIQAALSAASRVLETSLLNFVR